MNPYEGRENNWFNRTTMGVSPKVTDRYLEMYDGN